MGEVIGAQRARLRALRDEGEITDEVRRTIEYDLDLEQARLDRVLAPGARRAGSGWRGRSCRARRAASVSEMPMPSGSA